MTQSPATAEFLRILWRMGPLSPARPGWSAAETLLAPLYWALEGAIRHAFHGSRCVHPPSPIPFLSRPAFAAHRPGGYQN